MMIFEFHCQADGNVVKCKYEVIIVKSNCEICMNYYYDEEYECYACSMDLDEDEMYRFVQGGNEECHYFRMGDDYTIVRKQN